MVAVAGLIDTNEEQKGVALCSFRILTTVTTLEHCAGVRFRVSSSCTGDDSALPKTSAVVKNRGRENIACFSGSKNCVMMAL